MAVGVPTDIAPGQTVYACLEPLIATSELNHTLSPQYIWKPIVVARTVKNWEPNVNTVTP